MSVDQTNVVDAIGVDNVTGDVVLTVTDHLGWAESVNEHLFMLQEKFNTYLSFIESGEILETYPDAKDRTVIIDVLCKYPLNREAKDFYNQVMKIVEGAGIKLRHRVFNP